MKVRCLLVGAFVACVLGTAPVWAQTTGSISGTVFDQGGQVVDGATVRITGDALPGGRTATTAASGRYSFQLLLPGAYTIEISKTGIGTSTRQAVVEVGRDTQIEVALGLQVQESIQVVSSTPKVDLKSSEVNFNFNRETIESLPLERSYRGLLQLMPGVAENRSAVGPAAGGSRQDNTYLVDGVNITNPGFGHLNTDVNELDIAEFSVKRGGITAEFGRSAGVVTNAVSKSGTNTLAGAVRLEWMPESFVGAYKDKAFPDDLLRAVVNPAASVGGRVVKDKLFFYGSARYFQDHKWGRTNRNGQALPDEERTGHELFGKLTATPSPKHLVNVSFRDRPNDNKNAGLGAASSAAVGYTSNNSSRVASGTWGWFLSDRSVADVKYVYYREFNEDTPITSLGYLPAFNVQNLSAMGLYTDPTQNNLLIGGAEYTNSQNYTRSEIKGSFTQYLDAGGSQHEVKVGYGYEFGEEELSRLSNGWGALANVTVSGQRRIRARYYFTQPAQLGQGRTWSIFAQDNITMGTRLTVNAGLLMNKDSFAQDLKDSGGCPTTVTLKGGNAPFRSDGDRCTFLEFGYGDEIQPRLGVNYNVRQGSGDKVYANWGRYYNMDQKSSGRSLAPRRIYQREAQYDALTGALVSDVPRASTTGKLIDPDIKPTHNDEILAGYATPFGTHYSLDVFFQYRRTRNFIEDVPSVLPDTGPYAAANLPCSRFAACAGAEATRKYRAFTVEVARQMANRVATNLSYTWSRFEGNFDLDYSGGAVFNTSSFIQDGPGTNVQEPNRYGPLRQDRPHVLKLFTSVNMTDALTFGGYFRAQSGSPWNARARDWEGAVLNYLEPAGSHRNPAWANLDLMAAYRVRLNDRATLTFDARVLNALGNQTQLSTDGQKYLDLNTVSAPPYFAPYTLANAFFGTANQYAPPRRLMLTAQMNF